MSRARPPLPPDGVHTLAALIALFGVEGPLAPALAAAVDAVHRPPDPRRALALRLAKRRGPTAALGRPTADGPAAAARFLRRLGRRHRVWQAPEDAATLSTLSPRALQRALQAATGPALTLDLVSAAPLGAPSNQRAPQP